MSSDRVVRWDQIRREHLSYAINLILTFAVATLGFLVTLLLGDRSSGYAPFQRDLFLLSFILAGISVTCGIAATISRLYDFRLTAKVVRKEERAPHPDANEKMEIDQNRSCAKTFGKFSWLMFNIQTGAFSLAVLLAAASIFMIAVSV